MCGNSAGYIDFSRIKYYLTSYTRLFRAGVDITFLFSETTLTLNMYDECRIKGTVLFVERLSGARKYWIFPSPLPQSKWEINTPTSSYIDHSGLFFSIFPS